MGVVRAVGLALVAVLALSAVATSSASANTYGPGEGFTAGQEFTGSQKTTNVFTVGSSKVECKKATFKGTIPAAGSATATAIPTYEECEFGGFSATVTNSHCAYEFQQPTAGGLEWFGGVKIINSGGTCKFTIDAAGFCNVFVSAQGPLNTVEAMNLSPATGMDINSKVEKVKFTSEGGLCGIGGVPPEGENATYTGEVEEHGVIVK